MILSHSNGDHIAATKAVCDNYKVERAVHPGVLRNKAFWNAAKRAIAREATADNCEVLNLRQQRLEPGTRFRIGQATATLVCGFELPPDGWGLQGDSEKFNGGSIILRVTYRGRSILFCGDAVGRHLNSPANTCLGTELFMVENSGRVPIRSDVIIAPHHGANNGSSPRFIQTVRPKCVIFSAGHKHHHPTRAAAQRYLAFGLDRADMFRTDRGDDEGGTEWNHLRRRRAVDPKGDDDVDVLIRNNGRVVGDYARP